MTFTKQHNILSIIVLCLALVIPAITAQAQELNARKHGTILDQIEFSNLKQQQKTRVQEILDYAFQFRGVPYRHGQSSPRGFDCSGFTSFVFKRFGINLDRTSSGQIYDGKRVSRNDLQPGDLVFFNGRAVGKRIGHVGIVTQVNDDNTFKFIHAACSRGITESHSTETYYSRRYMGACRVVE